MIGRGKIEEFLYYRIKEALTPMLVLPTIYFNMDLVTSILFILQLKKGLEFQELTVLQRYILP
jgi:hypothetical protein